MFDMMLAQHLVSFATELFIMGLLGLFCCASVQLSVINSGVYS